MTKENLLIFQSLQMERFETPTDKKFANLQAQKVAKGLNIS